MVSSATSLETTHGYEKTDLLTGYESLGASAFLLRGLLSEGECNFIIEAIHADCDVQLDVPASLGFELGASAHNLGGIGPVKRTSKGEVHNRKDRFLFLSEELSAILWQRMTPALMDVVGKGVEIFRAKEQFEGFVDSRTGLGQRRIDSEYIVSSTPSACLDKADLSLTVGEEWLGKWHPAFCNPIFEVMSYPIGGCFRPHLDANLLYRERVDELQNAFADIKTLTTDPERLSSRSLYTIVAYLTGKTDKDDQFPPFAGGETNLLENSYAEKLLYTDDEGGFQEGRKRVFASVLPERGAALVFYQKGLLHEGADIVQLNTTKQSNSHCNKKIILRSDVFFQRIACEGDRCDAVADSGGPHQSISGANCVQAEELFEESSSNGEYVYGDDDFPS